MHKSPMLTESRKRRHSCDAEETQLPPQAKRLMDPTFFPELSHDVWDTESSSSDSSAISSPERPVGTSSISQSTDQSGKYNLQDSCNSASYGHSLEELTVPLGESDASYHYINRILREAHFSSLQTRGHPGPT